MSTEYRALSRSDVEDVWHVDLGGDLVRWTVHAGPLGVRNVVDALRTAANDGLFSVREDASLTDLHEDRYSSCSLELGIDAFAGFIVDPTRRIELNAHPKELFRNDRSAWRSYLRLCERLCDRTGFVGTLTSLRGEWFFLAYFPILGLWLARAREFSIDDDFDGPGFD